MLFRSAIDRNIDLGFDDSTTPAIIGGDPILLKEMLGNLLDNAIRYTQSGGQVTVAVTPRGSNFLLSVEDNGPGIPSEERERVFERFHRLLGNGADGCGLGLAIVREIALGHGAIITLADGAGGKGTRIVLEFPLHAGPTA